MSVKNLSGMECNKTYVYDHIKYLLFLIWIFVMFTFLCIHWISCFIEFYEAFGILGSIMFGFMLTYNLILVWCFFVY